MPFFTDIGSIDRHGIHWRTALLPLLARASSRCRIEAHENGPSFVRVDRTVIGIYPRLAEDPGEGFPGHRISVIRLSVTVSSLTRLSVTKTATRLSATIGLFSNTWWEERTAVPQSSIRDDRMTPSAEVCPGYVTKHADEHRVGGESRVSDAYEPGDRARRRCRRGAAPRVARRRWGITAERQTDAKNGDQGNSKHLHRFDPDS